MISFSGRKKAGNCVRTLEHINDLLESKDVKRTLIDILDYDISSCSACRYQCFDPGEECPVGDDVEELYGEIVDNDILFIAVPVYSGAPCSKYFAWRERSQSVFYDPDFYNRCERVSKYYIVIGNEDAGGREAVQLISADLKAHEDIILLQSHNYSQSSISGRLVENDGVKDKLDSFVDKAVKQHRLMKKKIRSLEDFEQRV